MRVYIIDDSKVITTVLKGNLENASEKIRVSIFEDVTHAISSDAEQPDIIILDHFLESTNGIDALPEIKSQYPNSKVIVLSGQTDVKMMTKAYENGADLYYYKNNDALIDVVKAVKEIQDENCSPSAFKNIFNRLKKTFARIGSSKDKKLVFILEESDSMALKIAKELDHKFMVDIELFKDAESCTNMLHKKPDVIITDYMFKGKITADDFLPEVTKFSPDSKTYVLSSQKDVEVASRLMKHNVERYYVKSKKSIEKLMNEIDL